MERVLEPEWLDELPASDARAAGSRADLRRLNAILGHAGILSRVLGRRLPPWGPPRIADLGAGDGRLLLAIARRLQRPGFATLVDLHPAVSADTVAAYTRLGWSVSILSRDAHEFLARTRLAFDAVVANHFLHHFGQAPLERLLAAALGRTGLFVACEPRRARAALTASRLLWALGCNGVTRHDAVVSVRAGFRGGELSAAWPPGGKWWLEEREAGLFSHLFVAQRHGRLDPG
ncbi:MAG TPA: methyltransferase domain-containing protein [Myxococcota bacterium]|nr:methyltransferase domain-containing protein [Myxococcota bacterium]